MNEPNYSTSAKPLWIPLLTKDMSSLGLPKIHTENLSYCNVGGWPKGAHTQNFKDVLNVKVVVRHGQLDAGSVYLIILLALYASVEVYCLFMGTLM